MQNERTANGDHNGITFTSPTGVARTRTAVYSEPDDRGDYAMYTGASRTADYPSGGDHHDRSKFTAPEEVEMRDYHAGQDATSIRIQPDQDGMAIGTSNKAHPPAGGARNGTTVYIGPDGDRDGPKDYHGVDEHEAGSYPGQGVVSTGANQPRRPQGQDRIYESVPDGELTPRTRDYGPRPPPDGAAKPYPPKNQTGTYPGPDVELKNGPRNSNPERQESRPAMKKHAHAHAPKGVQNYPAPDDDENMSMSSCSEPDGFDDCDCVEQEAIKFGKIPYLAIYDTKEAVEERGYFMPGMPVTAKIVRAERDPDGMLHLINPYIYTIDLEHGTFAWTIQKRFVDFQRLHNGLSRYRTGAKIAGIFGRRNNEVETNLTYAGGGDLVEIPAQEDLSQGLKNRAVLRKQPTQEGLDAVRRGPNAQYDKPIYDEEGRVEFRPPRTNGGDDDRDERRGSTMSQRESVMRGQRQKRTQARHSRLPHFPMLPDSVIGEDGLEERKNQLQSYLSKILHVHAYRNHYETAQFVEVGRLSFVHNLGQKQKEGMVKRRPGGAFTKGVVRNFCITRCYKWRHSWLVLKDTFLTYTDPKEETIGDVITFDHTFEVKIHGDNVEETQGVHKGLHICNMQRELLLKTSSRDEAVYWKREIENVLHGPGKIWTQENPHKSTFPVRQNVYGHWLVDGRSLMEQVANMMEIAKEEIFISDWWLNPQIYMKRPCPPDDRWRLDKILQRKAQEGVRVFIMVYREIPQVLALGSQLMEEYMMSLHSNILVLRHPDHVLAGVVSYSHHEKLVVVDQNAAFVGGIDLCYGRWDDHMHRLTDLGGLEKCTMEELGIDVEKFKEEYQKEISPPPSPGISDGEKVTDKAGATNFAFNAQSESDEKAGKAAVGGQKKPMDVFEILQMKRERMEAIAASDIWKSKLKSLREKMKDENKEMFVGKDYGNPLYKDLPEPEKAFDDYVDRSVIPRMPWHDMACVVYGSAARDVARHFVQRWNQARSDLATRDAKYRKYSPILPKSYDNVGVPQVFRRMAVPCNIQIVRSVSTWSAGMRDTEASVHDAYVKIISEAKHYIYIENQFFCSQIGEPNLKNKIAQALFDRILKAHRNKETFRVYILMPLLPGFMKASGSMQMVLHWTCTSINKGPKSLLDNLQRAIGDYSEYICFYGLRNYAELLGKLVTELVYIHAKIMIIDERKVIIGSANINDRSQMGDRDSEVCVIFEDSQFTPSTMNGQPYQSGTFAGSLRRRLMQEHLGLLHNANEEAGVHRVEIIDVTDPVSPEFFGLWNEIAARNTDLFDQVFKCAPSDELTTLGEWAKREAETNTMANTNKENALQIVRGVRGHLVQFPLKFLSKSDLMKDRFVPESLMPAYTFN